jgi:hypothetical protein
MREVDLGKSRKARVWLDSLPPIGCVGETREIMVLPAAGKSNLRRLAAVEVYVPLGGRFQYGLVGCQVVPSQAGQLRVVIAVDESSSKVFDTSLLSSSLDVSYVGLPKEYIPALKEGFRLAEEQLGGTGAGDLVITQSVYSNIGSSPNTFKILAIVLMHLIHLVTVNPTNEEIVALFEDAWI